MADYRSLERKINTLRKRAEQLPEAEMDFSGVPSDVLRKIAYPEEEGKLTDSELSEILREYDVIKSE